VIVSAIADHLWQSTWFALAAWLLALCVRKDFARVRYWVWFAASLKFLVPLAAFAWVGNHFIVQLHDRPALLPIVKQVTAPLVGGTISIDSVGETTKQVLIGIWMLGSAALLVRWAIAWIRSRTLVRMSVASDIGAPIDVRCSDDVVAPAVIGILNPVILLPRYALMALTPVQIRSIIAHELWHVRRRDNLAAAIQALAQILFWFHPLVWWIGVKLVAEREYACDEGVVEDGHDPLDYAATLLHVCRESLASRLMCAAGIDGGDLSARVRAIVSQRVPSGRRLVGRVVVGATLIGWIGVPVASGMIVVATSELKVAAGASSIQLSKAGERSFIVMQGDYVYARNVSLRELVSEAYSVHPYDVRSQSRMLDAPRYDIELRAPSGGASDPQRLVAALLEQQFNLELVVRSTL
jgi:beta-lactamase regulating signal transducer with metallopeptidase domain